MEEDEDEGEREWAELNEDEEDDEELRAGRGRRCFEEVEGSGREGVEVCVRERVWDLF